MAPDELTRMNVTLGRVPKDHLCSFSIVTHLYTRWTTAWWLTDYGHNHRLRQYSNIVENMAKGLLGGLKGIDAFGKVGAYPHICEL